MVFLIEFLKRRFISGFSIKWTFIIGMCLQVIVYKVFFIKESKSRAVVYLQ